MALICITIKGNWHNDPYLCHYNTGHQCQAPLHSPGTGETGLTALTYVILTGDMHSRHHRAHLGHCNKEISTTALMGAIRTEEMLYNRGNCHRSTHLGHCNREIVTLALTWVTVAEHTCPRHITLSCCSHTWAHSPLSSRCSVSHPGPAPLPRWAGVAEFCPVCHRLCLISCRGWLNIASDSDRAGAGRERPSLRVTGQCQARPATGDSSEQPPFPRGQCPQHLRDISLAWNSSRLLRRCWEPDLSSEGDTSAPGM